MSCAGVINYKLSHAIKMALCFLFFDSLDVALGIGNVVLLTTGVLGLKSTLMCKTIVQRKLTVEFNPSLTICISSVEFCFFTVDCSLNSVTYNLTIRWLPQPSNGCLYIATIAFTQQRLPLSSNDCLYPVMIALIMQRLPE